MFIQEAFTLQKPFNFWGISKESVYTRIIISIHKHKVAGSSA